MYRSNEKSFNIEILFSIFRRLVGQSRSLGRVKITVKAEQSLKQAASYI